MTKTKIHITIKLEKLIKKLIVTDQDSVIGILGKWNATLFFIDRKKCWLITNGLSKYNVILIDVKASDYSNMEQLFKDALFEQFTYDG